jgi:hypothetical protein
VAKTPPLDEKVTTNGIQVVVMKAGRGSNWFYSGQELPGRDRARRDIALFRRLRGRLDLSEMRGYCSLNESLE